MAEVEPGSVVARSVAAQSVSAQSSMSSGVRLGRYLLHEEIGRGPTFVVHRAATHGVEGFVKDVALKVPHALLEADRARHDALLDAARCAIALSHASLLQLVDIGRAPPAAGEQPVTFLVTELARGPSLGWLLEQALAREVRLSLAASLMIAADVARALDCAHRRSFAGRPIVHGALHAGQVFVTREGQVKVADFCVAAAGRSGADGAREDGERHDLAALGSLLAAMRGAGEGAATADVDDIVAKLVQRELDDAAGVHERLLEIAFRLGPAHEDRDPGVFVRAVLDSDGRVPVVAPPLDLSAALQPPPSPLPPVTRERGSAGGLWRFVGRSRELHELGAAIAGTLERGASQLVLHGPQGVGKTRLARELARRVPTERVGFVFVECSGPQAHVSLGAIGRALRALLGASADGQLEADEVVPRLRAMGLDGAQVASLCACLGVTFVADAGASRVHDALAQLLGVVRLGKPLVIVFDDARDLDPASREVLRALVDSSAARELPVLFILVQAEWELEVVDPVQTTIVGELDDDDVAQLLANRLGARLIPPELFELVVDRAGGHPAFVQELARELLDAALVSVRGGVAELVSEPPADLLRSVAGIIEARVAALSPAIRRSLALVGLCSGGLGAQELAELTESTPALAARTLEELVQAGLGRSALEDRVFVSRAYADAALGLLQGAERSEVHARLGASFAAGAKELGDGPSAAYEASGAWLSAAEHFTNAGAPASAAEALHASACALERCGALAAAADLFARALFGVTRPELAVHCLEALARLADHAVFAALDLEEALGQAFLTAADSMLPLARAQVCVALAGALSRQGQLETAGVLLDQAEMLADGPIALLLHARLSLAARACDPLRGERALESFASSIGSADQGSLQPWLDAAAVAGLLADVALGARLLAHAPAADASPTQRAQLLLIEGDLAIARGAAAEASASYQRALALARAARPSREAALASLRLADLALTGEDTGDERARAFGLLSEASALAREAGDEALFELAQAALDFVEHGAQGRTALARQIDRAFARGRTHDALWLGWLACAAEQPPDTVALGELAERATRGGFSALARRARARLP